MKKKVKPLLLLAYILVISILFFTIYLQKYDDLSSYKGKTYYLNFSMDSKLLASCGENVPNFHNVQVWSTFDNKLVQAYENKPKDIYTYKVFFSNDAKRLFAITSSGISIYENEGSCYLTTNPLVISSVCLSKNCKRLAMTQDSWIPETRIYLTDMITYLPNRLDNTVLEYNQLFYGYSYQFICQDNILVCIQGNQDIILRDAKTFQTIKKINYPIIIITPRLFNGSHFSENGKFLIAKSKEKDSQELWSIEKDQKIKDIPGYFSYFSADSKFFAHVNPDHTISIYSVETGEVIQKFPGHSGKIYAMCFSPNGQWLATSSKDKKIKLWNANLPCAKESVLSNLNESDSDNVFKIKADWNLVVPEKVDQKNIHYLIELLRHPNPNIRFKATVALRETMSLRNIDVDIKESIPQLIQNLDDDDFCVIANSISILGSIASATNDLNVVKKIVASLIGTFKYASVKVDSVKGYSMPDDSIRALLKINRTKNIIPTLIQALKSTDKGIRMHAAYALKYFKNLDENAIHVLIQTCSDPELEVRNFANLTLEKIDCKEKSITEEKVTPIFIQTLQNSDKNILLIDAIRHVRTDLVKLLINAGADVNIRDENGDTTLFNIVYWIKDGILYCGDAKIVKLLVNAGADVNAKSSHGETALIIASSHGEFEIVKLLLNAGADVNAKNNYGDTALTIASKEGYIDIVKLLIEASKEKR